MKEIVGDLFEQDCDAICITTNCVVKKNGELVMGAGCALQAKNRWPALPKIFSKKPSEPYMALKQEINSPYHVISFPTKIHFQDPANIDLIINSCSILKLITDYNDFKKIIIPRPGCGLGGLDWQIVKDAIASILDDRFYIINK